MRLIFWSSAGVLLHTYLIYPLLLVVLGNITQLMSDLRFGLTRRTRRVDRGEAACPRGSIVFAAHNEEAVIAQKMSNCASLDYPVEALEILVGGNGCTYATAGPARARRRAHA